MTSAHTTIPTGPNARDFPALEQLRAQRSRARVPYVPQMQMADCGAASLASVLHYFGREVRLDEIRGAMGLGRDGSSLQGIRRCAEGYGLRGRGVRVDLDEVRFLPRASILHWNLAHFVVFERVSRRGVHIVDPAAGPRFVSWSTFSDSFSGVALVFDKTEAFVPVHAASNRVFAYLRAMFSERGGITRVLLMSVVLRVLAAALPLLTALVVDRIVPRADADLLWIVSGGLVAIVAFQLLSQLVRAHLLLELRTRLDVRMTLGFLQHLISLPLQFFQTRSAGDLMMRVNSNAAIRELLTSTSLSALLDGALVLVYLALIAVLSPLIAAVVLGLAAIQVLLFFLSKTRYRELMSQELETQANSHSYLVQMVEGIETLKVCGAEQSAVRNWSNLFTRSLNVGLDRGRLEALVEALLSSVKSGAPLIVLCIGAHQTIIGSLSLGTMLAVNALAIGFLTPLGTLVDNLVSMQGLASYIERIDDVLREQREQADADVVQAGKLRGHVHMEQVSFRYAAGSKLVVRGASIEITPGSKVALVGRSGSGKSTLAALMLGLYTPQEGTIEFDGKPLHQLEARSIRQQMGVVTQSPYIFSGTIRENLTLGGAHVPHHRLVRAATLACIHDDIMAMPMGYDTPVTEGGGSLSGGQKQRLSLTRALVSDPAILMLDEATSALDSQTEALVAANLSTLRCTQLVIAHRLSTIIDADMIVVVDDGRIVETGTHDDLLLRQGTYHKLIAAQAGRAASAVSLEGSVS